MYMYLTARMASCTRRCCERHPRACRQQARNGAAPSSAADATLTRRSHFERDVSPAVKQQLHALAEDNMLAVSHTTAGNLPFARNWHAHLRHAGVRNFALIATDGNAFTALREEMGGHLVRCPASILGQVCQVRAQRLLYEPELARKRAS